MYYVVSKSTGKVNTCDGREELISYIASFNCKFGRRKRNLLLENIAMNKNDKKLKYDFYYSKNILIPREYIVYDEAGRIIDPRFYQEEILNFKPGNLMQNMESNSYNECESGFAEKKAVKAIARCGNKFRHYYRCVKTTNEIRNNAIPEYEQYVRGRRKVSHLITAWDDYLVHTEKNWKRLKISKQYMKNIRFGLLSSKGY